MKLLGKIFRPKMPLEKSRKSQGFAIAPILYLLGLIGVGAGVLFSGYSQILRTNQTMSNTLMAKNDLQGSATTLAATAWLSNDQTVLCPPLAGSNSPSTPSANCSTNGKAVTVGQSLASASAGSLPANAAGIDLAGSPVEVGVFKAGFGTKVLDPWGHYYLYCRWENSIGGSPAIEIISAGPNGRTESNCGSTTAGGDDLLVVWSTAVTQNKAAVWQTSVGTSGAVEGAQFGATGSQVYIDTAGDMTVPGSLVVAGSATFGSTTIGTTTAGIITTSGIIDSGFLNVAGVTTLTNDMSGTNASLSGTLGVTGVTTLSALSAGTSVLSSATVSGNAGIGGTLGVTGAATLDSLLVTNTTYLGGNLTTSNAIVQIGTAALATGSSSPLLTVGKPTGVVYPFSVDQYGDAVGGTFTGGFVGNLSGSQSGGSVAATTISASGLTTGSDATYTGTVTAASFNGTFNGTLGTMTGVVPIANGGTGQTTAAAALTSLFGTAGTLAGIIPGADLVSGTVNKTQLNATGVAAGTYNSVTIDTDGRIYSASVLSTSTGSITDGIGDSISVGTGNATITIGSSVQGYWNATGLMIGSGTPAVNKLDVYGGVAIGAGYAGSSIAPTNGAIIQGNVGIGTDNPQGYTLYVNGPLFSTAFVGDGSGLTGIGTSAITGVIDPTHGGTGTSTTFTQGSVVFAGPSGVYAQDNANFFWDATNHRLGIGTTAPRSFIEAFGGEIQVGSSGVGCTSANAGALRYSGATLYFCDGSGTWTASSAGGASGTVNVGSQYQMAYYAADGNTVSGDAQIITNAGNDLQILSGGVAVGTTRFSDAHGAVKLGVYGTSGDQIAVIDGTATLSLFAGNGAAGEGGYFGTISNHPLGFYTNDITRMTLTAGGKLGVGTATPQSLIQAYNGEVQVSSSGAACASNNGGALRFNGATLYYCDGVSTWQTLVSGSGAANLIVGTSTITAGTNTRVLFDNNGILGEYPITGTGNVVMSNSPTLTGTTSAANLVLSGSETLSFGTTYNTTGTHADVNLNGSSTARYTGAGTATFYGLVAGNSGQILYLHNDSASTLTLSNLSGSEGTAANQIITGTGSDMSVLADAVVSLQYDSSANSGQGAWRVTGSSQAATAQAAGTIGQIQFNGGTYLAADSKLFWDNTLKRLGIGTAAPQSMVEAFNGEVQVGSSSASCAANNAGAMRYFGGTLYYCNGTAWTGSSAGGASGTVNVGSQYQMAYYAADGSVVSGDANVVTDASNNFQILVGNLGIGTSNVTNAITIDGQVARTIGMVRGYAGTTNGQNLTLTAGGAKNGGTDLAGGTTIISSGISTGMGASNIQFQTYPAAASTSATDNAALTALTLSATGVTGSNAATTLQANAGSGNNKNGGTLTLASGVSTGTGESGINFNVYGAGASGSTANTATTAMTISSGGKVGIGTTQPVSPLDVVGTSSNLRLTNVLSTVPTFLDANTSGSSVWSNNIDSFDVIQDTSRPSWRMALSQASDSFSIQRTGAGASWNPSLLMYITNGGYVGLGTNNPQSLLQAYGGEVQVGSSSAACAANNNGAIRFSGTTLYYCTGTTWTALGASGASGTVSIGTQYDLAYYAATGSTVSPLPTANNGVLVTDGSGAPSIGSSLPTAVQLNITNTGTITTGTWNGSTVTVPYGGTGATSFTAHGVLIGEGTSAVSATGAGTAGYLLTSNGAGSDPTFSQLNLGTSTGITGTLGVTNGGTGTATAFTPGSVVFAGASGVYTQDNANFFWDATNHRLGIGTTTPFSALEAFGGEVQVGSSSAACSTNNAGAIRYSGGTLYYCNGATWTASSAGGASGTVNSATQYQMAYYAATGNVVSGDANVVTDASNNFQILSGSLSIGTSNVTNTITLDGQAARTIGMIRATTAIAGGNLTINAGGGQSGGTNLAGGNLILSSGQSTGNTTSNIQFQTYPAGSTGTTDTTALTALAMTATGATGTNAVTTLQANSGTVGGTNQNGGTLTLASGLSTGSGTSSMNFQVYGAGSSGTTSNAPTTAMTIASNGAIGIGTVTPQSLLSVQAGEVQVGSSSASCAANNNGAIRFSGGTLYYCTGTTWTALGASGASGTVNSATQYQMAYYATTGTAVSGDPRIVTDASDNFTVVSGNLNIGTTTAAYGALKIGGQNAISFPSTDSDTFGSVAIGSSALNRQSALASTAFHNTAVGYQAISSASLTAAAVGNTALGYQALKANTTAAGNTAIGNQAGLLITTGGANTVLGSAVASTTLTTGGSNILIGVDNTTDTYSSGSTNVIGIGQSVKPGTGDIAIGQSALLTNGGDNLNNIAIGNNVMASGSMTSGAAHNTAVGNNAMNRLTSGGQNTAFGYSAADQITSGSQNDSFGYQAMHAVTSGSRNVAIGNSALHEIVSGQQNTALGDGAMNNLIGGASYNTALGASALDANVSGNSNIGIGHDVGSVTLASGDKNILIGADNTIDTPTASTSNFLNIGNTIFATNTNTGTLASPAGSVGIGTTDPRSKLDVYNAEVQVGSSSASCAANNNGAIRFSGTTLYYCTGTTWTALGASGSSGTVNSATQYQMAYYATTGTTVSGDANIFTDASNNLTLGTSSVLYGALKIGGQNAISFPPTDTTIFGSIAIGSSALANQPASAAYGNTAIGYQTLSSPSMTTAAVRNTAVGYQAAQSITTASKNSAFGWQALQNTTTGGHNVAIGQGALAGNLTGSGNVAVGVEALFRMDAVSGNIAIGDQVLNNDSSGDNNVAVGGMGANTTGSGNTAAGSGVLSANISGNNNVAMGRDAANHITTGNNNTVLGYNVANTTLATGSNNILIGVDNTVDTPASGTSNFLNIGNTIFATGVNSGSLASPAGSVGIGTVTPQSKFTVQAGEVQVGSSGASCASNNAGAMRYSGGTLYYCNGTAWTGSSSGGGSGTVNIGTQYQMAYYATTGSAVSGDANIVTNASNDLLISSGKLGVGTAGPLARLSVESTITDNTNDHDLNTTGLLGVLYSFVNAAGYSVATVAPSAATVNEVEGFVGAVDAPASNGFDVGAASGLKGVVTVESTQNNGFMSGVLGAGYSLGGNVNTLKGGDFTGKARLGTVGQLYGINGYSEFSSGDTSGTTSYQVAVAGYAFQYGGLNSGSLIGLDAGASVQGSGATTDIYGARIGANSDLTTLVTGSMYGLYVSTAMDVGTTVANRYGIYIADGAGGEVAVGDDFGLYQASVTQKNYFAGKVGIGTKAPQSMVEAFGGEVQVGSSSAACAANNAGAIRFSGTTLYYCTGTTWTALGASGSSGTVNSATQYQMAYYATTGTAVSGDANVVTDASNNFQILAGKLSIGTSNVTNAITLDGQAARTIGMLRDYTASTAGQNLTLTAGGAVSGGSNLVGGNLILSSGIATGLGSSNVQFQLYPAGSTGSTDATALTALTMTATGATGSNAVTTLQANSGTVGGTNQNGGNLTLASGLSTGSGTSSMNFKVYGAGSSGTTSNAATTAMTIDSTGNVGIGTTNPSVALDVNGIGRIMGQNSTATTTLNMGGGLAAGVTSATVNSTTGFPSSGTLWIDGEAMTYASKTGTVFQSLTRGVLGTTAALHNNSANVKLLAGLVSSGGQPAITFLNDGTGLFGTSGSGTGSIGFGNTTELAYSSIAGGNGAYTNGPYSIAVGVNVGATGQQSAAFGDNVTAPAYDEFVAGAYNVTTGSEDGNNWVVTDPLFQIGNGQSGTPSNAMTILKNGKVGLGTSTPQSLLVAQGGEVQVGSSSAACAAKNNGAIRYSGGTLYYCTSTTWTALGASGSSGTVNSATQYQMAYYATTGTAVSGDANIFTDASNNLTLGTSSVLYGALKIGGQNAISFPSTDSDTFGSVAIGSSALNRQSALASTAFHNTAVGYQAISSASLTAAAVGNTALGYQALKANTTAAGNTAIGNQAGLLITTGGANTVLGSAVASTTLTTGSSNILIGVDSSTDTFSASTSNAIGIGQGAKPGTGDIAIGPSALAGNAANSLNNIAIGNNAINSGTMTGSAAHNTIMGNFAMNGSVTSANNNTGMGDSVFNNITTGDNNAAVGYFAMKAVTTGTRNSGIGNSVLDQVTTGHHNVGVGDQAGHSITTGTNNTALGAGVGSTTLSTGDHNILIGVDGTVDTPAAGTTNFLNIGNTIFATSTNTGSVASPAGSVGIGTVSPQSKLTVQAGEVQVGSSSASCAGNNAGAIRYSSTNLYYCNGTTWTALGASGSSGTVNSATQYQMAYYATTGTAVSGDANVVTDASNNFQILAGKLSIGTSNVTNAITLDGQNARTVGMLRNYTGSTAGQNMTISAGGAVSGGSNLVGGNLILSSGIATGLGSSNVQFQTYPAGSTGSTDATALTALTMTATGATGTNAVTTLQANSGTVGATNQNGGNLTLASGLSTGSGTSSMSFKVYGAGSSGTTSNAATTAMTIASTGRVGIGSTSPVSPLNVVSSTAAAGNTIAVQSTASDGYSEIAFLDNNGAYAGYVGYANTGASSTAGEFYFNPNSNIHTVFGDVSGAGNVGIAANNPTSARLVIKGVTSDSTTAIINAQAQDATSRFYVRSDGKIGLGTTTPQSLLVAQGGEVQVGSSSASCAGNNAGAIRYSSTSLYYCNGTTWTALGASGSSGTVNSATQYQMAYYATTGTTVSGDANIFTDASNNLTLGTSSVLYGALKVAGLNGLSFPTGDTNARGGSIAIGPSALASMPAQSAGAIVAGNIAIGSQVMSSASMTTAARNNIGIGYQALKVVTSGDQNIGIGTQALAAATTGFQNVAMGDYALKTDTTGFDNVAIGQEAMTLTAGSQFNVAIGYAAMYCPGGGCNPTYSTAVGNQSLSNNSGQHNTAVGGGAGNSITSGSFNTILGDGVGYGTLSTGNYNILIGTDTTVDTPAAGTSNFLNIGNAIYASDLRNGTNTGGTGYIGIGTTAPQQKLHVYVASGIAMQLQDGAAICNHTASSSSETISCSSDVKLKKDIVDSASALTTFGDMRIRDFTMRATGERRTGVIAQEIQITHPDMVHMGSNNYLTVDEPNPWLFVKAIQELKALLDEVHNLLTKLTAMFEADHNDLEKLKAQNDAQAAEIRALNARLDKLEAKQHK